MGAPRRASVFEKQALFKLLWEPNRRCSSCCLSHHDYGSHLPFYNSLVCFDHRLFSCTVNIVTVTGMTMSIYDVSMSRGALQLAIQCYSHQANHHSRLTLDGSAFPYQTLTKPLPSLLDQVVSG